MVLERHTVGWVLLHFLRCLFESERTEMQGVIDTALRTADSGYLYRRLDFTASPVVAIGLAGTGIGHRQLLLQEAVAQVRAEDCGTEDSIPMEVQGMRDSVASFKDRIRGRVLGKPVLYPESKEVLFDAGHLA